MRVNKKSFTEAAKESGGVQAVIAKRLGVQRSTITMFLKKHPEMKEVLEREREEIIDVAEKELFTAVKEAKRWAVEKILDTLGKDRGYVEKTEIENTHKGEDFKLIIHPPVEKEKK